MGTTSSTAVDSLRAEHKTRSEKKYGIFAPVVKDMRFVIMLSDGCSAPAGGFGYFVLDGI